MKNKFIALLLAGSMVLSLAACGSAPAASSSVPEAPASSAESTAPEAAPEAEQAPTEQVFTDDAGREVVLPAEITGFVPSGPIAQIILFAIAPEKFVGLTSRWDACAEGIIPAEYWELPTFGQLYGSKELNVEALAAAAPQLIIDVGEAKKSVVEDLDTLQQQTGVPTVHIAATLKTMPDTYRTLGALLGEEERGEQLAQFCEKIYAQMENVLAQVGENKTRALYIGGAEGLNVIAKDSYHAELLDLLTDNLAVVENPSGKGLGNEVTMDQLLLWDPDFIIFAPESIAATAAELPLWADMRAIASGNYVETPQGPHCWMGTPPAVQRYLGMIWLTAALYPEFCDYDVKAEVLEYYELFYHCALTDAQYEALTASAFRK